MLPQEAFATHACIGGSSGANESLHPKTFALFSQLPVRKPSAVALERRECGGILLTPDRAAGNVDQLALGSQVPLLIEPPSRFGTGAMLLRHSNRQIGNDRALAASAARLPSD